jgi:hypothetical protein
LADFRITEEFTKRKTYSVEGLHIDIYEDEYVLGYDYDGIIYKEHSVLTGLLKDDIDCIKKGYIEGNSETPCFYLILCSTGQIIIEVL